jgi:hypothetical protein
MGSEGLEITVTGKSRVLCATLIAVVVLSYTTAVVIGKIPAERQLSGTNLVLLVSTAVLCLLIVRPQVLDRLGSFEGLGFKFELLQQLQERQVKQAEELYRLDLIVPLLFREGERVHLENLLSGTTKDYSGGSTVRDELRRLRAIGLLRSLPNKHIGDLHGDTVFDLAEWVDLTTLGRYWAERMGRLDQAASLAERKNDRTQS